VSPPGDPFDYLAVEDLLEIAAHVLDDVEVRDLGLLASAAGRPQSVVFGHEPYATLAEKAAALLHSLARNHPLVDGNRRLAWTATRVFCLLNGHDLRLTAGEAQALVAGTADGELAVREIAATIGDHLR
jgi:death-on-curing protein